MSTFPIFHVGGSDAGLNVAGKLQFFLPAQNEFVGVGSNQPTLFAVAENGPYAAIYGANWLDQTTPCPLQNNAIFAECFTSGIATSYPTSGVYSMVNLLNGANLMDFNPAEGGFIAAFRAEVHIYGTSHADALIGYVSELNLDDPTASTNAMIGFHSVVLLGTDASSGSVTIPKLYHFLAEGPTIPDTDGVLATVTDAYGLYVRSQISNSSGTTVTNPYGVYIEDQGTGAAIYAAGGLSHFLGGIVAPLGTPASSSAPGVVGQIQWDENNIYVCTASNVWKRAALTTF